MGVIADTQVEEEEVEEVNAEPEVEEEARLNKLYTCIHMCIIYIYIEKDILIIYTYMFLNIAHIYIYIHMRIYIYIYVDCCWALGLGLGGPRFRVQGFRV